MISLSAALLALSGCLPAPLRGGAAGPAPTPDAAASAEQPVPVPTGTVLGSAGATAEAPAGATVGGPLLVYQDVRADTVVLWAAPPAGAGARPLVRIEDPTGYGVHLSLSPDGSRVAYARLPAGGGISPLDAELWVTDLGDAAPRQLATGIDIGRYVNYPIWSPDGRQIAFRRQSAPTGAFTQTIALAAAGGSGERVLVTTDSSTWLEPLDWSPDGRYLYFTRGIAPADLWRVEAADPDAGRAPGAEKLLRIPGLGAPRCYFLSPDGAQFLCTVLESRSPARYAVVLVPTGATGQVSTLVSGAGDEVYNPIWSPTGREVALSLPGEDGAAARLVAIDLAARSVRTLAAAASGVFIPQSWPPDGAWVAAQTYPGTTNGLTLIPGQGGSPRRLAAANAGAPAAWLSAAKAAESSFGAGTPAMAEAQPACAAPEACPQAAATGVQPYPSELSPVFAQAGQNQLGNAGPALPQIWSGCPAGVGNGCPSSQQVSPFVPCVLLRAMGWVESSWLQFRAAYGQTGATVISADCGYGIMQITSGMSGGSGFDPARVAAEPAYNLGTGAMMAIGKWNAFNFYVGANDPQVGEDWYYAVWAYNGWVYKNNPNNPAYPYPRDAYGCGQVPGQTRANYPYQELVWGCAANPPSGYWPAVALSLPDRASLNSDPPPAWIARPQPSHSGCTTPVLDRHFYLPLVTGAGGG